MSDMKDRISAVLKTLRALEKAHEEKGLFQAALAYGGAINLVEELLEPAPVESTEDDEEEVDRG